MRTGEEVNIGGVEWQSSVRTVDTPAFVLKLVVIARSFPRGPLPSSFLSGPYRSIPQVPQAIPGHRPPTTPHSTDPPSPSTTVSFSLFSINTTPVSFLPTLFPYYDLSRCLFQRF